MPNFTIPYKPDHPVFPLPSKEKLKELYKKLGFDEFEKRIQERNNLIHLSEQDPLRYGVKLKQWALVEDCLRKYDTVIALGGNQSSKSFMGAYFTAKTAYEKRWWDKTQDEPVKIACLHTVSDASIRQQQPLVYKYLPPEWRDLGKIGKTTNISYTQKNGFSENVFITPDKSECSFFNYQQDVDVIQGYTLDFIWADELLNSAWLKELPYRIMARSGKMLITVTLIHGMIGAIKSIADNCKIVQTKKVDCSLFKDLTPTSILAKNCPPLEVPVLAVDEKTRSAIIWLHTEENPFNPRQNLIKNVSGKSREQVLIRAYGYCESTAVSAFPKFDERVHCISLKNLKKHISKTKYTLYMSADPGGSKPWVFKYYIVDEMGTTFLIYESPEFELFGAWAEPPDKDQAQPKWKRGAAHSAYMGANVISLKNRFKEIEEIELPKILEKKVDVFERFIDPRMGAMTVPNAESETSFISLMEEENTDKDGKVIAESYFFTAAYSGASGQGKDPIEASVFIINNKLDFNSKDKLSPMNMPKFFILDTLKNTINTYKNYSLQNHRDCPLKDFLDPDRYFFNMDVGFVNEQLIPIFTDITGY